jgi:thioredoxin
LVDFWAPWCGPCKMVAPELRKVANETAGQLLIAKVNTEELPTLGRRFRVTAIPTLALFKNGIEVARQAGAMPAPAIRKFLERDLAMRQ